QQLLDDTSLELHGEDASAVRLPWKLAHEALPSCRSRIAPSVSSSIGEPIRRGSAASWRESSRTSLDAPAPRPDCTGARASTRYWITSSARSNNDCGIRPRAFAVLRLITSSNLVEYERIWEGCLPRASRRTRACSSEPIERRWAG